MTQNRDDKTRVEKLVAEVGEVFDAILAGKGVQQLLGEDRAVAQSLRRHSAFVEQLLGRRPR